ncbi:MAG TPA: hypothetical protein VIT23_03435 [Terrimicrobiaceae bacterium]
MTKFPGPDGSNPIEIPLSTNAEADPAATPAISDPNLYVDLNARLSNSAPYPIIPSPSPTPPPGAKNPFPVPASWVYLLRDPTKPADADNPIIGRYAFWMDDENARININTAYGKPATILSDIPGTSPVRNYLVRSNPLDQTADNGKTWYGKATFQPEVGFNSLVGDVNTGDSTASITIYNGCEPGKGPYAPSDKNANVVGSNVTSPAPASDKRRYYPIWHPSAVNIDILPSSLGSSTPIGLSLDRNALANWVFNKQQFSATVFTQDWRLLKFPEQIKQFVSTATSSAAPDDFYSANRFNLTAYSRAPEFNAFGKPRLFMEARINSKGTSGSAKDTNNSPYQNNPGLTGNASGTELAFYLTPDLDPLGPSYFHGFENTKPFTFVPAFKGYYSDLTAVQMVGDYLSGMLLRADWPGMPASSFVDKWGGGDIGKREADQVAWNIVAMGNYAPGTEYAASVAGYWAALGLTFDRIMGPAKSDADDNLSPYQTLVSNQIVMPDTGKYDPNLALRVGKLSGKAIMPYTPKPYVSEAALVVEAVPFDEADRDKGFFLKLSMQLELYIGRRGPPAGFNAHNGTPAFKVTHFFYTATGTDPANADIDIKQGATGTLGFGDGGLSDGYGITFKGQNPDGVGSPVTGVLMGSFPLPTGFKNDNFLPVDTYITLMSDLPSVQPGRAFYIAPGLVMRREPPKGTAATPPTLVPVPSAAQKFNGTTTIGKTTVRIEAKARLALCNGDTDKTYEMMPVWDKVNTDRDALKPPAGQEDSISWDFEIDLSSIPSTGGTFIRSLEIADPRLGGNTHDQDGNVLWKAHIDTPETSVEVDAHSLGGPNSNGTFDPETFAYFDFQAAGMSRGFYINSPRPSIGFLSCLPTGMQRGIVNSMPNFGPSPNKDNLPDWLLLDLVAPIFPDLSQPSIVPYSYLHSTMGKININANIYPNVGVTRNLPLQALFKNLVPDAELATLANNIVNHTLSGRDFGGQGRYDYIGELCEVKGVADGLYTPGGTSGSGWQKMALIRNLANLITTQSNTFHIWGAAQALRVIKKAGNTNYATYESGDTVVVSGEKRFESTIERSVWQGVDGVPGNGHANNSGVYDQKSNDTTSTNPAPNLQPWAAVAISASAAPSARLPNTDAEWAHFDGPDDPTPLRAAYPPMPGWYSLEYSSPSALKDALNPIRAHMTYKPIMFRYATE